MKRVCSFFMAVLLCCSLVAQAFAATLTPLTEENTVAPGQKIVVTATVDQGYENIILLETRMYFDSNLFTFDSAGTTDVAAGWNVAKNPITDKDTGKTYVQISIANMSAAGTSEAGVVAKLSFTANDTITEETATSFIGKFMGGATANADVGEGEEKSTPVTVTPAPRYAVNASGPSNSITVGETAQVALKIGNSDETIKTYNAYYMEVSYDAEKLTYVSINTDATVTDNDGALKIAGYGTDKTCDTDNIVLTFTGKAVGEANVTVNSAKVDAKENASGQDAPAATLLTKEAAVSVGGYQVTLPEGFTGNSTVAPDNDYTFRADNTNYDYTFTVQVGESGTANVTDNQNGSYTISKDDINGNLTITVATKTGKTRNVTVTGSGAADVTLTNEGKATYGTAYTFTVNEDAKYIYTVTAKIGTENIAVSGNNGSYTIAGDALTGDVVINVDKAEKPAETTTINFEGSGANDVKGGTSQTATNGENFTFELIKQDGYTYKVELDGEELTAGEDGKYTIPGSKINGTALTVTITATAPAYTIAVSKYMDMDAKIMYLITASGNVGEGKVLNYGESKMYWSEKYSAYAWLVISDKTLDEVEAEAAAAVKLADGEKTNIDYTGDVNLTGVTDINDAQLVWNMYKVDYKDDFVTVNVQKYLTADVNGDRVLNTNDAVVIVNGLVGKN